MTGVGREIRSSVAVIMVAWGLATGGPAEAATEAGLPAGVSCGPWKIVPSPAPIYSVTLSGISGTSSTDVWAVGSGSGSVLPVILHWDGTAWTQVPPAPRKDANLNAVAAVTPTDAWAVGSLGALSIAEHWDGSVWRKVTTPRPGNSQYVYDVAAISSTDVWAVGNFTDQEGEIRPFTMHWEGQRWTFVPAPDAAIGANVFYGVSAASTDDVWAVGYQEIAAYNFQPLIEHWDGSAWSVVPAPPPSGITNFLHEVEAISSTDVWAVGDFEGLPTLPLIEHWDGTSWSLVEAPPLPGSSNALFAVSAAAPDDVWAAGQHIPGPSGGYLPLTLHWDGISWSEVRAKSPGENGNFHDIVAQSPDDVWAAGAFYESGGSLQPLTEHSNGCLSS